MTRLNTAVREIKVVHARSRDVVSTLVLWYASDMQSYNRTIVHKDAGHSRLLEKWSYYYGMLVACSPLIER